MSELPKLIKFPRTEHFWNLGAATRQDKVYSGPVSGAFIVEEKIDGANLGIRLHQNQILVQNRSHYLSGEEHPQFKSVHQFVEQHRESLTNILANDHILFGEWCLAKHTIPYSRLPAYFVAFDLYDAKRNSFCSRQDFHRRLKQVRIPVAPVIGQVDVQNRGEMETEIMTFLEQPSVFRSDGGFLEGVILRQGNMRLKVVRGDFRQSCEGLHWTRKGFKKQRIDFGFTPKYIETCYSLAAQPTSNEKSRFQDRRGRKHRKMLQKIHVPRCIMLIGVPGSGKSTFATALREGLFRPCVIANQDDLGKRKCREVAASKTTVVLDRCNLQCSERAEWRKIMHNPSPKELTAVVFKRSIEECIHSAENRPDHPTIANHQGARIVRHQERVEQPLSKEERKSFGAIENVHDFSDARALLQKWGCC